MTSNTGGTDICVSLTLWNNSGAWYGHTSSRLTAASFGKGHLLGKWGMSDWVLGVYVDAWRNQPWWCKHYTDDSVCSSLGLLVYRCHNYHNENSTWRHHSNRKVYICHKNTLRTWPHTTGSPLIPIQRNKSSYTIPMLVATILTGYLWLQSKQLSYLTYCWSMMCALNPLCYASASWSMCWSWHSLHP